MIRPRWSVLAGIAAGLALAGTAGCGSDSGSDGSGGSDAPVLVMFEISPTSAHVAQNGSVAFAATATYSDGSTLPADAAWAAVGAGATFSAPQGSAVSADSIAPGVTLVIATFEGMTAEASIVAQALGVWPGLAYGCTNTGNIVQYPSDGSEPTVLPVGGNGDGIVLSPDGQFLYTLAEQWGYPRLLRISTADPSQAVIVADLTNAGWNTGGMDHPMGLDHDRSGNIYTFGGNGNILRFDPASYTGQMLPPVVPVWKTGTAGGLDLAIGPFPHWDSREDFGDTDFTQPLLASPGGGWITKRFVYPEYNFDALGPYADVPADLPTESGSFVSAGVAMNAQGDAFTMDTYGDVLYRFVDANRDGDANDTGETVAWASLGGGYQAGEAYGISVVAGGGVLVNRKPLGGGPGTLLDGDPGTPFDDGNPLTGVWLVTDLNGDGDTTDADEVKLFSAAYMYNGYDGGCITAPR